ncbi:hypothetical protein PAXRUDRAFT_144231 [Paxillus rubicundulus Ve08.2h10]|uniref:Uncharacterized protein n=1 Tax=Paxillus rubicundulus Ve08.2h10 TaxID=930991 RepID=A0A0D0D9Q7_9AGAM|nr:hypothetical protein PAXRUDRAFT_144231 [Paxillus rubicundulus Ve08.2h10]
MDSPTCSTLIRPSNFQIWKLWIMVKLQREKVLGVALGTDICSIIPVTSFSISSTTATVTWNEKAHGIIQDSIRNDLLLNIEAHTTAWDLFNVLLSDKNYKRVVISQTT